MLGWPNAIKRYVENCVIRIYKSAVIFWHKRPTLILVNKIYSLFSYFLFFFLLRISEKVIYRRFLILVIRNAGPFIKIVIIIRDGNKRSFYSINGKGFDKQDVCTKIINYSVNEFYYTGLQRFHSYTVTVCG